MQAQLKIEHPEGREDEITEVCLKVREKWLYAWLKLHHADIASRAIDSLLIIHDELEPHFLSAFWAVGGGSLKVRKHQFEGASARETFRAVNQTNHSPLKLIAQKTTGYAADFYVPVSIISQSR